MVHTMLEHLKQVIDAALYFSAGVGATRLWDALHKQSERRKE